MNAIKEFLVQKLQNTAIFEMALERNKFMSKVDALKLQIAENYILIRYCTLSNTNMDLRSHWCTELIAHLENIFSEQIKSDKKKALVQELKTWSEFDDVDKVSILVSKKMKKEASIIKDNDILEQAINDFAKFGLDDLIELMSAKITMKNFNYISECVYNKI